MNHRVISLITKNNHLVSFVKIRRTMIAGINTIDKGNRCDTLVRTIKSPVTFIFGKEASINLSLVFKWM